MPKVYFFHYFTFRSDFLLVNTLTKTLTNATDQGIGSEHEFFTHSFSFSALLKEEIKWIDAFQNIQLQKDRNIQTLTNAVYIDTEISKYSQRAVRREILKKLKSKEIEIEIAIILIVSLNCLRVTFVSVRIKNREPKQR